MSNDLMHTPGPWVAVRNSAYWEINPASIHHEGPFSVADVCASSPGDPDGGLQEANARLIASAPELLDALRRAALALAFASESSPAMRDDYNAVSAAIAKATGSAA